MQLSFKQHEIDHHSLKLIVGGIAILLPVLTSLLAEDLSGCLASGSIQSISASYHAGGWARDIFVGFLFAIASFLFAYNGESKIEWASSKLAGISALAVALFPCSCECLDKALDGVHGGAAAVMFLFLAGMCRIFYGRACAKGHRQAKWRANIYAVCGWTILAAIAALGFDMVLAGAISDRFPRLVFYGEAVGLWAFGITWMVASRALPVITTPQERTKVLPVKGSGQ